MFKIGTLNDTKDEKIEITRMKLNRHKNGVYEELEVLRFSIYVNYDNQEISFSFALNCPDKDLLEIPMSKTIDFKSYIFQGETFFVVDDEPEIDPELDISVNRYLNNSFIFNLRFQSYFNSDPIYAGNIEFNFNLDDYMIK